MYLGAEDYNLSRLTPGLAEYSVIRSVVLCELSRMDYCNCYRNRTMASRSVLPC